MATKNIKLYAQNIGSAQSPCYLVVIKANDLYPISTVSRAEDDPKVGYQRMTNKSRVSKIAQYYTKGGIIPGAIVLSARAGSKLHYDPKRQEITIPRENSLLFVIDGQHRLLGAHNSKVNPIVSACILPNLTLEEEVQYFLDINGNQKGVPAALRLEVIKFLSNPDTLDVIRRKLFDALDQDPDSPLCGKMNRTKSAKGSISHVSLVAAIREIVDVYPLSETDTLGKIKLIKNYLRVISDMLIEVEGSNGRIANAAFLQSILWQLPFACTKALEKHRNFKSESLYDVLSGIKSLDLSLMNGTNKRDIKTMSDAIKEAISEVNAFGSSKAVNDLM